MTQTIPIPATVWEQISIVIVFAILLGALGRVLVKLFVSAIADVNAHYGKIIMDTNITWQKYFDARSEANNLVSSQLIERLDTLADILKSLVADFEAHDIMERAMLDKMSIRQNKLDKPKKEP